MTTETDHLPARPADTDPLQQLIAAQLAWQQSVWRLALAPWGSAWPPHVTPAVRHSPSPAGHDQLAVPPAVAADGEHALFA